MKLLNRLRELREEHDQNTYTLDEHAYAYRDTQALDDDCLHSIGVGTTTIDDIMRLNVEHRNLQISILHCSAN